VNDSADASPILQKALCNDSIPKDRTVKPAEIKTKAQKTSSWVSAYEGLKNEIRVRHYSPIII